MFRISIPRHRVFGILIIFFGFISEALMPHQAPTNLRVVAAESVFLFTSIVFGRGLKKEFSNSALPLAPVQ